LHRQALKLLSPPDPNRFTSLNNLAKALWTQFQKGGQQGDLNEAILLYRQALELQPSPHSDKSAFLDDFANTLFTRFQLEGQQGDLDEAILLNRQALELRPPSHPNRSSSLNNLASVLSTQIEHKGQQGDLEEAILLYRQVLELLPPLHPDRSTYLNNLGSTLWLSTHFQQQYNIDEAILLHRQALELQPLPHPDRSASLNKIASALSTRFKLGDQKGDLNEAILLYKQALKLQAPPHPHRAMSLNGLASTLSTRFDQEGQRDDLDEAISLHRQALELLPLAHPNRSNSLQNLATLLIKAYLVTNNDPSLLAHAMSSFSEAIQCPSNSPSQHFRIAQIWAYYADLHQHPLAIKAYDAALSILPQLAALSLDVHSRHKALTVGSHGLACRAARCAIQKGCLDKAVEYLETGRAVFWSQLVHLRSPVDRLHNLAPELADRLCNIAAALEHGSHRDTFSETLDNQKKITLQQEASRLANLDKEWSKSIDEVRRLDDFKDFLQPSHLSSLQAAAAESSVVLLISNINDSHCLIVTSTSVQCITNFPILPVEKLRNLVYLIQAATSQSKIWRSSIEKISHNTSAFPPAIQEALRNWVSLEEKRAGRRAGQISSDDIFRSVLKTIWDEMVKPVIDFLGLQVSLRPLDNHQIHLQNISEIRGSSCVAVVPNWPIFFSSHPCSWLL
jgi:tetratricopeptide (TPR) repeat protein